MEGASKVTGSRVCRGGMLTPGMHSAAAPVRLFPRSKPLPAGVHLSQDLEKTRSLTPTPSRAREQAASPAERTAAAPKAMPPTPSSAARFLEDLLLQSSRPEAESARPQAFLPTRSSYSAGHLPQRNPNAQAPPPPPQLPCVTSRPIRCSAMGSVFLACGSWAE